MQGEKADFSINLIVSSLYISSIIELIQNDV
jgi:hypothetical protein